MIERGKERGLGGRGKKTRAPSSFSSLLLQRAREALSLLCLFLSFELLSLSLSPLLSSTQQFHAPQRGTRLHHEVRASPTGKERERRTQKKYTAFRRFERKLTTEINPFLFLSLPPSLSPAPPSQLSSSPTSSEPPPPQFSDFFSTKKPKDFRAGLASGGKSLLKGLAGGAAGLVAAPALGAATDGAAGFAKGLAAGLAGAVALPLAGAGVAIAQVVRGAAAAPGAARAEASGLVWDRRSRSWVDPNDLPVAIRSEGGPGPGCSSSSSSGAPAAASASAAATRRSTSPSDDDLYAVLGLSSRSATPDEIRKAYFAVARRLHPDKNPGDAAAAARFALCARAYAVLGDPASRARYDALGAAALDANGVSSSSLDPSVFFGMLFGSERFAHLVGEFSLLSSISSAASAAAAATGASGNGDASPSLSEVLKAEMEKQRLAQERREEALATNLLALLKRWEVGDEEGFAAAAAAEGAELSSASFGPPLLSTIAGAYAAAADRELAGPLAGRLAAAAASAGRLGAKAKAAGAAMRAAAAQLALEEASRREAAAVAAAREARERREERGEERGGEEAEGEEGKAAAAAADGSTTTPPTPTGAVAAAAGAAGAAAPPPAAAAAGRAHQTEHSATATAAAAATARAAAEAAALPAMLDAAWRATRCDIQSTLAGVCRRVLRGGSGSGSGRPGEAFAAVGDSVRLRRAAGLRALAGAFSAAAASAVAAAPGGSDPAKAARTSAEAARAAVEAVAMALAEAAAAKDGNGSD